MKARIKEAVVVEGRYDRAAVAAVVDTVILETAGFGVFSDGEKLELLRKVAAKRGIILLTDSDGAGFVIRNHLKGALPKEQVKQAYIPDVYGKERRKARPSKEGKLGVEGMDGETILQSLRRAGATFLDGAEEPEKREQITKAELYELGLSGTRDASARRSALLKALELPEHLSANAFLDVLNALVTREELIERVRALE